jgi:spore germination protein KA
MFKWMSGKKTPEGEKAHSLKIDELKEQLKKELVACSDLLFRTLKRKDKKIVICFVSSLIDKTGVDDYILKPIQESTESGWSVEDLAQILPITDLSGANQLNEIVKALIEGKTYIYSEGEPFGLLANLSNTVERSYHMQKRNHLSLVRKLLLPNHSSGMST